MQFYLRFAVNKLTIPLAYRYQVMSMLYKTMRIDELYSTLLHDVGFQNGRRTYRMFCFGELSGESTIYREEKKITFPASVFLEVRTTDEQLEELWMKAFQPGLTLNLFGQTLILKDVIEQQERIKRISCRIEMLSPMLAYQTMGKKTKYYNPLEPEFTQIIANNFVRKYEALTGEFVPAIQIIPESIGIGDKTVALFQKTYLTAWGGQYLLKGKPEHLSFLYDAGLGGKNAQGFGMFRVLE